MMCLTRLSHATLSVGSALDGASPASSDSCDPSLAGGVIVFVGMFCAVILDGAALLGVGLDARDSLSRGLLGSASFRSSSFAATLSSLCRWAVALTTPAARPTAFREIGGTGLVRLNPAELSATARLAAWCIAISGASREFTGGWFGNSRMYVIGCARPACAIVCGAEAVLSAVVFPLGGGGDMGE
jgi:hypothetical protein